MAGTLLQGALGTLLLAHLFQAHKVCQQHTRHTPAGTLSNVPLAHLCTQQSLLIIFKSGSAPFIQLAARRQSQLPPLCKSPGYACNLQLPESQVLQTCFGFLDLMVKASQVLLFPVVPRSLKRFFGLNVCIRRRAALYTGCYIMLKRPHSFESIVICSLTNLHRCALGGLALLGLGFGF